MVNGQEFFERNYPKVLLAAKSTLVNDQAQSLRLQREKAERNQQMGAEAVGMPGLMNNAGDDDVVNVGNETHYHAAPPAPPRPGIGGTLAKLAIGAGLIATGVGVPVGGYLIADAIRNAPVVAPVKVPPQKSFDFDLEAVP